VAADPPGGLDEALESIQKQIIKNKTAWNAPARVGLQPAAAAGGNRKAKNIR
jgi:hypothetical protein